MMSVLGRVRNAIGGISDTEWALIALEAVGVVASILIAFALSDWGSSRRDQNELDRLLVRMQGEVRSAVGLLSWRALEDNDLYSRSIPIAKELAAGRCPADLGEIDTLTFSRFFDRPALATIDELKNRGGLSAIPETLRAEVSRTEYQLDFVASSFAFYDKHLGGIISAEDRRRHSTLDEEAAALRLRGQTSWKSGIKPIYVDRFDRPALCADPAFRERYIAAVSFLQLQTIFRNDTAAQMVVLCDALAQATHDPCFTPSMRRRIGIERIAELEAMADTARKAHATNDPRTKT